MNQWWQRMISDKFKRFTLDSNPNHIFGIKSAIIWGENEGSATPLLYLRKPKSVSQEDYDDMVKRIKISFSKEAK